MSRFREGDVITYSGIREEGRVLEVVGVFDEVLIVNHKDGIRRTYVSSDDRLFLTRRPLREGDCLLIPQDWVERFGPTRKLTCVDNPYGPRAETGFISAWHTFYKAGFIHENGAAIDPDPRWSCSTCGCACTSACVDGGGGASQGEASNKILAGGGGGGGAGTAKPASDGGDAGLIHYSWVQVKPGKKYTVTVAKGGGGSSSFGPKKPQPAVTFVDLAWALWRTDPEVKEWCQLRGEGIGSPSTYSKAWDRDEPAGARDRAFDRAEAMLNHLPDEAMLNHLPKE